ncbi:MAG: DUF4868 domain-containing protein [Treponema sp.]|nr:DUF4868 domain-containing protein [Treponema sp.]
MNELSKFLSFLQDKKNHTTRLYLVTRTLKQHIHAQARIPNKYEYTCYTINTDQLIQNELFNLFLEKAEYCANEDKYQIENYSIVTDDSEKKILTYEKKEQISSFMRIVDIDIKNSSELPSVRDLSAISDKLWAYIIEISIKNEVIFGLRKMSPSKVLVSEKKNAIAANFKLKEKSLVISHDQSIVFDKRLDAFYADDKFFIIQKNNFEEIVGLESEYRDAAKQAADKIMKSPKISLNFNLIDAIENKNRFIRKLAKVKDKIDNIGTTRIQKMQETATLFKLSFNIKSGKIIIDDENELDIVIKLLDDYYLLSQQTGKKYEASVKKEI